MIEIWKLTLACCIFDYKRCRVVLLFDIIALTEVQNADILHKLTRCKDQDQEPTHGFTKSELHGRTSPTVVPGKPAPSIRTYREIYAFIYDKAKVEVVKEFQFNMINEIKYARKHFPQSFVKFQDIHPSDPLDFRRPPFTTLFKCLKSRWQIPLVSKSICNIVCRRLEVKNIIFN